ncbi:hypothetical protein CDD81_140 [Ophiocordyceps australis]|uniref:Uncharacterized protein n=1 Tax=Ophiocordyceps australis TaxID=1399860 RepID=A0A2C5YJ87_9HYPO|nr:hypothetical protein CDD81_140 [Ophiocordyceps australis]
MDMVQLFERQASRYTTCRNGVCRECINGVCRTFRSHRSVWLRLGRWILLGVLLFFVLSILMCCCCFARLRRRRGQRPMYGTGWMAPPHASNV